LPTFIQGTQNFAAPYTSGAVTKALSKNVTAGSLIAVAVWWFQAHSAASAPANISVTDNRNTHTKVYTEVEPSPGFYARFQVTFVPAAAAGATTISVSADQPGVLLWAAHEVSTDAGLNWVFNGGANGRINTNENPVVIGAPDSEGSYNSTNSYSFLAWAISDANELGNITSGPFGPNNRQYAVNNTPIASGGTFSWYGSLATWDALNQGTGSGTQIFIGPNRVQSVAVCVNFSLIVPSCDAAVASPPGGTYTGAQSVTLTQDQGKNLYYTLDGSTPTTSSTAYSAAIAITNSTQLKVLAHDASNVLADTVSNFNYSIVPAPPANANILITWERRTRVGGAWLDGTGTVPLSEESEQYDLEIYSLDGDTVIRSVKGLTTNSYDYTAALQYADFGQYVPCVYVKVYQISASVGRGFPATNPTAGKVD
jgi:hypothetical protein